MKSRISVFILLTLLTFLMPSFAMAQGGKDVAKVVAIRGHAFLVDGTPEGVKLKKGDWVQSGSVLETKTKGLVKLFFIDKTKLNIGPNSQLNIAQYFRNKTGLVKLIKGKVRVEVTKDYVAGADSKVKLLLRTKNSVMGVKGTIFTVQYVKETTSLFVGSGSVSMAPITPKIEAMLAKAAASKPEDATTTDEATAKEGDASTEEAATKDEATVADDSSTTEETTDEAAPVLATEELSALEVIATSSQAETVNQGQFTGVSGAVAANTAVQPPVTVPAELSNMLTNDEDMSYRTKEVAGVDPAILTNDNEEMVQVVEQQVGESAARVIASEVEAIVEEAQQVAAATSETAQASEQAQAQDILQEFIASIDEPETAEDDAVEVVLLEEPPSEMTDDITLDNQAPPEEKTTTLVDITVYGL